MLKSNVIVNEEVLHYLLVFDDGFCYGSYNECIETLNRCLEDGQSPDLYFWDDSKNDWELM